jgi:ABC-type uncharacterized transport system permease subunit
MYSTVFGGLAAILYVVTGSLLGVRLSRAGSGKTWRKAGLLAIGWSAVLAHAAMLVPLVIRPQGINLGFFNALSCTGWLTAVVLLLSAMVRPVENLGIILLPFSAATVILALLFPSEHIVADSHQWSLKIHILLSILA